MDNPNGRLEMSIIVIAGQTYDETLKLADFVTHIGHTTVCAHDGAEMMAKVHSVLPDAVLVDAATPIINGFQICREIRANPAFKNILIILVSDSGKKATKFYGLHQGADYTVTKPIDLDAFAKFLRKALK